MPCRICQTWLGLKALRYDSLSGGYILAVRHGRLGRTIGGGLHYARLLFRSRLPIRSPRLASCSMDLGTAV